jgi:hypothetical protein
LLEKGIKMEQLFNALAKVSRSPAFGGGELQKQIEKIGIFFRMYANADTSKKRGTSTISVPKI